jgi:hypothetical protein
MDYMVAPISESAESVHGQVLQNIENFIGDFPIKRRVFEAILTDRDGFLTDSLEDGLTHIVVDQKIAKFKKNTCCHKAFVKANPHMIVSPQDVFKGIVSHEYGHVFFEERVSPNVSYLARDSRFFYLPPEFDESFAFSFMRFVSGLEVPRDVFSCYKAEGLDSDRIEFLYSAICDLGKSDPKNILSSAALLQLIVNTRS